MESKLKKHEEATLMENANKQKYQNISSTTPKCQKKLSISKVMEILHVITMILIGILIFVLLTQLWKMIIGCPMPNNAQSYVCPYTGKKSEIRNDSELCKLYNELLNTCDIIKDEEKFDCFPRSVASEKECTARGCCWSTSNSSNVPWCFYPKRLASYKYVNSTKYKNGQMIIYELNKTSPYPNDIKFVKVEVTYETDSRLHVKISDASTQRYEPPYPEIPLLNTHSSNSPDLIFEEKDDGFFGFSIKRNNGKTIFGAHVGGFIFSDQLLQISAITDNDHYLYGLGEHRNEFVLDDNWNVITLFNHAIPPTDGANEYGSHPFYLAVDQNDTQSHGVFLLNSNAMDIILQPKGITYRSIGGVLDFYFFSGPKASEVVQQYTGLIGNPFLPPFWSLGFHLCRFGLKTLAETINLYEKTKLAMIPFDVQWNDIDYMHNRNDFTISDDFKQLTSFVESLHENGMHYIVILDPGVASSLAPGTYPPFDDGVKEQIFIKNSEGQILEGKVWNLDSATAFPDFSNPKTLEYWLKLLNDFHNKVPYDGIWLDMNEIENFVNGSLIGCGNDTKWDYPPYVPNVNGGSLSYRTVCMSAKHHTSMHYNLHNLHAFTETIATTFALAEIRGKRPFVLSRSTFAGFGHYGAHWTGDVFSTWDDMRHSISDILSFNIMGIPMIGADICGFNGNTTKELCQRWLQLGAFYPFSRSHNSDDATDQDPVSMGKEVVQSTIKALTIRYSMLPYLYTLFFKAHLYGHTVARPLFFEFPDDFLTYKINDQFLWGCGVMFVPVLRQGATWVSGYFPKGKWYDYYTSLTVTQQPGWVRVNAPLDIIPIFIRGGSVIPQITPGINTNETRKNAFFLTVALDGSEKANGDLLWDDGDSYNVFDQEEYNNITFVVANNSIKSTVNHFGYNTSMLLDKVNIMGLTSQVDAVNVDGKSHKQFTFDKQSMKLDIYGLKEDLSKPFSINWLFK